MKYKLTKRKCNFCKKVKARKDFRILYRPNGENIRHECKVCEKISHGKSPRSFISRLMAGAKQRKNLKFNLDLNYLEELYKNQKGKCAISKINMSNIAGKGHIDTNISIDRIDSTKGYIKGNVHLVCYIINRMKTDLELKDFKSYCRKVSNG